VHSIWAGKILFVTLPDNKIKLKKGFLPNVKRVMTFYVVKCFKWLFYDVSHFFL
jgi:hypothetical protein